jgi:hypothetical protein
VYAGVWLLVLVVCVSLLCLLGFRACHGVSLNVYFVLADIFLCVFVLSARCLIVSWAGGDSPVVSVA